MSFLFRYLRFHDIIGGIHVPVDDGVDKLNRKYTLLVFLFLALPIFTKQYIGDPIECFAPVYFAEHQSRYINSYCWTQSTYYMVPVGDPDDDGDQQEPPDRITPDELDYFISFETVTHIGNERLRRVRVSYYQWAPLILLAQGLCFYIPFLIWNSCANNAGVKLRRLLKKASDIASLPPGCQQREALLAEFVDQFHTLVMGEAGWCADLQCGGPSATVGVPPTSAGGTGSSSGSSASNSSAGSHHQAANGAGSATMARGRGGGTTTEDQHGRSHHHHHNSATNSNHHHQQQRGQERAEQQQQSAGCCLIGIPILGSLISCCLKPCASFGLVGPSKYLCLLYLAIKFAYVFNVGLQFFLLGKFLGRGYLRHGLELINRILMNGEWWASPRFPLSTLCQVRADMSGGLRSYTCQCVLPINVFNEKIFSVVWFYMAFLLPLNVLSLLFWVYRTFESNRMSYIRLCLWRTRLVELNQIHRTVRRLSQSYLGWDGVFLLRLIEHNHGSIMATLIMSRLWEFYANQIKLQEDANQIALANNAHNTLSNLTSNTQAAITNHQHGHGPANNHGHQHQPPPPPPPQAHQHHQQQQQYLTNQPHSHGHSHGSHAHHHPGAGGHHHVGGQMGGHSHGPAHNFAGAHGPHAPLQPTQVGGNNATQQFAGGGGPHPLPQPPPPMALTHQQHGHHSGQVSQAPGHHPLHAANTAASAHHVHHSAAALTAAAAAAAASGPHLSGAFTGAHANLLAQLQHQANTNSQQQQHNQQPPGNVAAAVAALAAAAAAATSNQPANNNNSNTTSISTTTSSATTNQGANSSTTNASSTTSTNTSANIHLNALKQQQQSQVASVAQAVTSNGISTTTTTATTVATTPASAGNSATTSFITANVSGGPPLPPPPPAHVVAAVAAASTGTVLPVGSRNVSRPGLSNSGAIAQQLGTSTSQTTAAAPAPPPHNLFNLKSSSSQQQTAATAANSSPLGGAGSSSSRFNNVASIGSATNSSSSTNTPAGHVVVPAPLIVPPTSNLKGRT